tara:strand:+ start:388 stop:741 length:354 start_codon:yes stop_codon:yes gene_type:complete
METKEMLEATIKGLQEKVNEITKDLQVKQAELEGINKPTMSENTYELLQDTIRESVDSLCFSSDDFEVELHMDYDNRVEINSLNFENHECIYDDIIRYIDKQFRVIENEDNPTTDDE